MPFAIRYGQSAERHLRALSARLQRVVLDAIDRQLIHQPTTPTRNKKKMRPNPLAPWELRAGALRVYYDVIEGDEPAVHVIAVGIKDRNTIYIGGDAVELGDEDN